MFGWRTRKISKPDKMGRYPAWYAAMEGDTKSLREALETGLDVDHADTDGLTMLGVAAIYGRDDAIGLLLDNGADPNRVDRHGNGPLWAATREAAKVNQSSGAALATPKTVGLLLARGADPTHRNKAGTTPALWADLLPELRAIYREAGFAGEFGQ